MNLLEIQELRIALRKIVPVRRVSLAVKKGEFVALVGGSGSGKSSLALSILRLQDQFKLSGKILFEGQDLLTMSEEEMIKIRGAKISMIFQEPMTSLNPLHRVGLQILESLKLHTDTATRQRVIALLKLVEIKDAERVYAAFPHELSGGQRQRIMIAMALAGRPDLLIADEPTTALDVCVQAQILALLKRLQTQLNLAILFITHDLDIVRKMADRVYVMKYGKIIATKVPKDNFTLERFPYPSTSQTPVIQVEHLNVFYDKFCAAAHVNFSLKAGQTLGIVGESGSGKSSVAFGLIRLVKATGRVLLDGQDFFALSGKKLARARAGLQMVFQDPSSSLNPRMMVSDIVAEGLKVHQSRFSEDQVIETLCAVGLSPDVAKRYPHELSGGQRTRVALARALILKPKVIILDEVTSSVDIYTQRQLLKLLEELQSKLGLAYIFIGHDMRIIQMISDQVMVMKEGKVIEQGSVHQIFNAPENPYTKELIAAGFLK
ncbi:MAG: dipeptide ABC transporter ATP-binding protein [Lactobacillales bacterium]|jgi:microcin C transport system ATP-binding protein|nr:dipeptide ABC transporter ATP-binding protein [Lactobacillales bacterium]